MPDITYEIKYKTARSGGKGGQNVNKVETMVEGSWHVLNSSQYELFQKEQIAEKLKNRINNEGFLQVRSQEDRSQLANKAIVLKKMQELIAKALIVPKKRRPVKIPKRIIEKRLSSKKINSAIKKQRRKPTADA